MGLQFSRLGLGGLEEQRKKEAEQRDISADTNQTKLRSRGMRRSYRDAMRSGNSMAAANILSMAKEGGIPMSPGIRGAGDLRRQVSNKYYEGRAAWEKTRAAAKQAPVNEWDQDGNGVPNSIQRDPATSPLAPTPVAAGPLESKLGLSKQASLNPRQQFASDLMRSDLIQSGDPAAMAKAYQRGEGLGLGRDQIRGYLDKKIMENPYEVGPDAGLGLSKTMLQDRDLEASASQLNKPAKPSNPLFEAAMARVAAAGGAARDADISGIERVGNLQAEMEAARQKTDLAYNRSYGAGSDATRIINQGYVDQQAMARGFAKDKSNRGADLALWNEQMERKAGIGRGVAVAQFGNIAKNATKSSLMMGILGRSDETANTKKADSILHGSSRPFSDMSGGELRALLNDVNQPAASQIEYQGALDLAKSALPQKSEMQQVKDFRNRLSDSIGSGDWLKKSGPSFYDRPSLDMVKPGMNPDQARFDLMKKDGYSAKNADALLAGRGITKEAVDKKSKDKPKKRDTTASQRAAWEKDVMSNPPVDNPDFAGSIFNKLSMELFKDPGGKRRATYERLKKEGKVK